MESALKVQVLLLFNHSNSVMSKDQFCFKDICTLTVFRGTKERLFKASQRKSSDQILPSSPAQLVFSLYFYIIFLFCTKGMSTDTLFMSSMSDICVTQFVRIRLLSVLSHLFLLMYLNISCLF